jgi:hypothetical protein
VITVMQAAESALRQAGLHRSGDDFQLLLTAFFAVQRRAGLMEGDAPPPRPRQPESTPKRQTRPAAPRRIPGLARKLR